MYTFRKTMSARKIAIVLIVAMGLLSIVPPVNASFIPSGDSQERTIRNQDLETISKALETKIIKQRLQDLGYSDQEIQDRLDQLSDQEIHNLAVQIDSLTQGGATGLIIGILVIIILVLVIFRLV
jgi:predicted PurR-regulated permease PerM